MSVEMRLRTWEQTPLGVLTLGGVPIANSSGLDANLIFSALREL